MASFQPGKFNGVPIVQDSQSPGIPVTQIDSMESILAGVAAFEATRRSPHVVDTIADMQALEDPYLIDGQTYQTIRATSSDTAGDGTSAYYLYDADSTATVGDSVVNGPSGVGRFLLLTSAASSVVSSWWDMEKDGGCIPFNHPDGKTQQTATHNTQVIQAFLDSWEAQEGKAAWLFPANSYAINAQLIFPNCVNGSIYCLGGEGWIASEDSYNGAGDERGGPASRLVWNGPVGSGSGPMIRYRGQGLQIKGCLTLQGHWDASSRENLQNNNFVDSKYEEFCETAWIFEGRNTTAINPPVGIESIIGMGKANIDNLKLSCFRTGVQFGEHKNQNHADNVTINRITGEYMQTLVEINNEQSVNHVFGYVRGYVVQNTFLWRDGGSVWVTFAEIFNGGDNPVGPARLIYMPGKSLDPNPRLYNLQGNWDPASGLPGGGTAQTYDVWKVTTNGVSLGGETWYAGDWLIAKVDNASTNAANFSSNWTRQKSTSTLAQTSAGFKVGSVKFDAQSPQGAGGADLRIIDMDLPQWCTVDIGGCFSSNGQNLNRKIATVRGGCALNIHDVHVQYSGNQTPQVEMHSDVTYGQPSVHLSDMRILTGTDMTTLIHPDSTGNGTLRWSGCTQHSGAIQTDGWVEMLNGVVQTAKDIGSLFGDGTVKQVIAGIPTVGANITAATTSEVDLVSATPSIKTLPAGFFEQYSVGRFKAYGYYSTPASAPELTLRFKANNNTLRTIVIPANSLPDSSTNLLWRVTAELHVRSVGASGTAMCVLIAEFYNDYTGTWYTIYNTTGTTVSIDTTVDNPIALTAQWTSITGSPSITCHGHYLDKVAN